MYHTLKYYRLFSVPANNKQCFRHTKLDIFLPRFIFLTLHICLCTSFFLNCSFLLLFSNQNLKIPGKFYTPLSNTSKNGNTSSYTDSPLPLLTQKESYDGQYSALFFGLFFSLALPGGLAILGHNALH